MDASGLIGTTDSSSRETLKTIVHPVRPSPRLNDQIGQAIGPKTRLMLSRTTLNRIIIIGFMVLVGFCLAKAIYHKSFMGITLAIVSLVAAINFLYILVKAREEMEAEESTQ